MSSDDDLFDFSGPAENQPTSGGSSTSSSSRSSQDEDLFRTNLGPNIKRQGNSVNKPLLASLIHYTFSVASRFIGRDELTTSARSVYDYVNMASEGEVDERLIQYEMESLLVILHGQKSLMNTVHEALEAQGRERSIATARFGMYIDCYVDYLNFCLETTSKEYVEYSQQHGLKIEKSVLERGVYAYVTPALAVLGGNPPGDFHYRYGDISQLRSRTHALINIWISYGLQMILEKESTSFEEVFA